VPLLSLREVTDDKLLNLMRLAEHAVDPARTTGQ
jgi:hypothetical protein